MARWLVGGVLCLVSCGGGGAAKPIAQPEPSAQPEALPEAGPVSPAAANPLAFDFETPLDTNVWKGGIADGTTTNAMTLDVGVAHGGKQSLRLRGVPAMQAGFIASRASFPLDQVRGHRLAVSAWVRTELGAGWGGLWCRVDGPDKATLSFDNMQDRPLKGTTDWTQVVVRVAAPPSATAVVCGPLVVGTGDVWLDDLVLEREGTLSEEEFRAPVKVAGVVIDADKKPLAGMTVRASMGTDDRPVVAPANSATTGPDGSFELLLPPASWSYEIVATSPTVAAGVRAAVNVAPLAPVTALEVKAGGKAHIVSGRVLSLDGKPVGGVLAGVSETRDDWSMPMLLVTSAADGTYRIALPPGRYTPRVIGDGGLGVAPVSFDLTKDRRTDLRFARRDELAVEAPAAVVEWAKRSAVPLASAEAGKGTDDLDGFAPAIGKARIVAVGEGTHGTREFSQLKHRMLEYLVARHGFSVFAIEGGYSEMIALDDYVVNGKGDLDTAITGVYGVWQTVETRAMFEWMRAWNADPAHPTKIRVYGVDVQQPGLAYTAAIAYLGRVDPDEAKRAESLLAPLGSEPSSTDYAARAPAERRAIRDGLVALLARFDREKVRYEKASSPREWLLARQHVNLLRQHEQYLEPPPGEAGYVVRDKGMAENMTWLVEEAEPGARVVFWAHNAHISRAGYDGWMSVGERVAKRYGRDYVSIGFMWNQGGFRAHAPQGGRLHDVGPESPGGIGATFAKVGVPLFAIDLRRAPKAVRAWLDAPHFTRDIGATYTTDANMEAVFHVGRMFDAILYVDTTSAAVSLTR